MDLTKELAATIRKYIDQKDPATIVKGKVSALNMTNPPSVSVQLSGDGTDIPGVRFVQNYKPNLNDTVLVAKQKNSMIIIDRVQTEAGTDPTSLADDAQGAANTAQSTANTAQSTANTAQSTANTANTNANTALSSAHTHANRYYSGHFLMSVTGGQINVTNITNLGLNSGNYIPIATVGTTVPGPEPLGRNISIGTRGPSNSDLATGNAFQVYLQRSTSVDTRIYYIVSLLGNPITA